MQIQTRQKTSARRCSLLKKRNPPEGGGLRMTGARLAGFWIILLKLHDYCCNIFVSLMRLGSMSRVAKETGYETSFVSRRTKRMPFLTAFCPTSWTLSADSRWRPAPSRPRPATSSSRFAAHQGFFPSSCERSSPSATIIPSTSLKSPPCTPRPSAASWTPTSASERVRVRPLTSHSRTSASCRAGSAPRPPSSSAIP